MIPGRGAALAASIRGRFGGLAFRVADSLTDIFDEQAGETLGARGVRLANARCDHSQSKYDGISIFVGNAER